MGLSIERITCRDFRSYERFELDGIGGLTLIVGPNAVGKTNLLEGIQLIDHDVDVVASDTCALHGDTLAFVSACDGMALTARNLALFLVEVRCYEGYTTWVAY